MGEGAKEEPVETAEPEPEQPAEPEPEKPAEPVPEPAEEKPEEFGANWQNVMNYLTYGNDPNSKWSQPGGKDGGAAQKFAEAKGWKPMSQDTANKAGPKGFDEDVGKLQQVMAQDPSMQDFYKAWQEGSGRVSANGEQINRGDAGDEVIDKAETDKVKSDIRVKNVQKALSDCRMKYILEDYNSGHGITPEDFMWLARQMGGKFTHNNREYDFFNDDDWNDDNDGSVLKGYAEHIRNYLYTYKPEATEIDSSIDPDEEHIGPMAQDIEMVNPACVKETPEGVKTVDTARLAMMNAGAIGDLARQTQELTDKLKELGL